MEQLKTMARLLVEREEITVPITVAKAFRRFCRENGIGYGYHKINTGYVRFVYYGAMVDTPTGEK